MPELIQPTTSAATIDCDCCRGIMRHSSGVTFECPDCGDTWSPDWTPIHVLDEAMCAASVDDGQNIEQIIDLAVNGQTITGDPDHYPDLGMLVDNLNLPFYVSERMVISWAAWRTSLDQTADTL